MAQHDYVIDNQSGAAFRADLNSALGAIATVNSGSTAPGTTYAHQLWADTGTSRLRMRNSSNTGWIEVGTLGTANLGLVTSAGASFTGNLTVTVANESSYTAASGTVNVKGFASSAGSNGGIGTFSNHPFNIYANGLSTVSFPVSGGIAATAQSSFSTTAVSTPALVVSANNFNSIIRLQQAGTTYGNLGANSGRSFNVANQSGTDVLYCDQTGNLVASANVTAYSDKRLKKDIKTIEGALEMVNAMRGVRYTKDGVQSVGVIAQEVLDVVPEVVHDNGDFLSVAYGNLVGVLIEAVKELSAEVKALKEKCDGAQ